MSLPPVERAYVKDEYAREWKNGNASFKLPEPVPMLRFLYELCSTMVSSKSLCSFFFLSFSLRLCIVNTCYGRVFGLNCVCGCFQVRGELPFQKCKAALDSVEFSDNVSDQELASSFADIITQMSQDVSPVNGF
jgi:THO complex subunit 2